MTDVPGTDLGCFSGELTSELAWWPVLQAGQRASECTVLVAEREGGSGLCALLADPAREVVRASRVEEAACLCHERAVRAVLVSHDLPGGGWKELLRSLRGLPLPPHLIVLADDADPHLWVDVYQEGGFDLLPRSCGDEQVLRLVVRACERWQRQADVLAARVCNRREGETHEATPDGVAS